MVSKEVEREHELTENPHLLYCGFQRKSRTKQIEQYLRRWDDESRDSS
jgi:hypothetical protein